MPPTVARSTLSVNSVAKIAEDARDDTEFRHGLLRSHVVKGSAPVLLTLSVVMILTPLVKRTSAQDGPSLLRDVADSVGSLGTALQAKWPGFEVASVKVDTFSPPGMSIRTLPGGRFIARNVPLNVLIRRAYGLQTYQIVGGPSWIVSDRFDIEAKAPGAPATDAHLVVLMLRTLLADRFHFRGHAETRELPTYSLVKARTNERLGPALRSSTIDCSAEAPSRTPSNAARQLSAPPPKSEGQCDLRVGGGPNGNTLAVRGVSIAKFAEYLQPYVRRMIVDKTQLKGTFDIELDFFMDPAVAGLPAPAGPPVVSDSPSLFEALEKQLGLKLEPHRGPVAVLVVDNAEQPSEN